MSEKRVLDGADAILVFGGEPVGGIQRYEFFQAQPTVIRHKPLAGLATEYLPAQPDYGTVSLSLYRDSADNGQHKLALSQANRIVENCELHLSDGRVILFRSFCESLPLVGGKVTGQRVTTSQARLRVTGLVTTPEED